MRGPAATQATSTTSHGCISEPYIHSLIPYDRNLFLNLGGNEVNSKLTEKLTNKIYLGNLEPLAGGWNNNFLPFLGYCQIIGESWPRLDSILQWRLISWGGSYYKLGSYYRYKVLY